MNVSDHKCLSCNAQLKFNPESQKWDCEYCASSFSLEELEEYYNKKNQEENKTTSDLSGYNCPNCGAEIIMEDTTTATSCVYCGSNAIIKDKLKGEFSPSKIIPFKKTKQQAIEAFKAYKKGKLFMPDEFTNPANIDKISGIYIPFYIYDCNVDSTVNIDAKRIRTWSDYSYNYTETSVYSVVRSGTMFFDNIPVDSSTKFPDDIMNSIEPFDYSEFKDFNTSYLSGFLSERYDKTIDELFHIAEKRAKNTAINELLNTVQGYTYKSIKSNSTNVTNNSTSEYVLLPVWMLNVNFNNKIYTFAMNGQTGKFIGNIPISKKKVVKYWAAIFAGSLACSGLLYFLSTLF